jgi:CMP-N-acetylneuraminic acid synthetase
MTNTQTPIIAFLPCRRGSERVKEKNTRRFAGIEGGLTRIKMEQLLNCPEIDSIVVSTDDPKVADISSALAKESSKSVKIVERPPHLATSATSTDEVIKYIPEIITEGIILWTHVTSPFVDSSVYTKAIQVYREQTAVDSYDSLMSVTKIQKFLWNQDKPINYDRNQEKWPRTQTLPVIFEVNSALFMAPIEVYLQCQDRIGKKVYLFELTASQALDIDWEEDFKLAEGYWHYGQ